jgi:hypothetical protein
MKPVHFTQYLRPDGRTRPMHIVRDEAMAALAEQIAARGYQFSVEELRTGEVSLTVDPPPGTEDDAPVAHEVVSNGPDVPLAVDRLIVTAHRLVTPQTDRELKS